MKTPAKTTSSAGEAQGAVRINISLPAKLVRELSPVLQARGYIGLSDYVRSCLRRDAGLELGK